MLCYNTCVKTKCRCQLALTTAVSKTHGLLGALTRIFIITLTLRFVNFRWGKDNKIWLFLTLQSSRPGSARADDVNVEEVAVDMGLGAAERFLIGIPAVWIMLPEDGKRTIR